MPLSTALLNVHAGLCFRPRKESETELVPLEPPEDIHDGALEEEIALLSELIVLVVEADGPVTQDQVDNALGLRPPAAEVTLRDEDPSSRLSG